MRPVPPHGRPWVFWAAVVVGWVVLGFGVWGLLANADATHPVNWALFFGASLVAHDGVIAPVVFVLAVVAVRRFPSWARSAVQAGLIVAGIVVLVGYPFVRGYGGRPDNPTLLPRNYGAGVALLVGGIFVVTACEVARRAWARRSHSRDEARARASEDTPVLGED